MEQNNQYRYDMLVVVGMIFFAVFFSLYFQVRFLESTIFFFAVPSLYLLLKKPKNIRRIFTGTLAGMLLAFSLEFLAEINSAWAFAPSGQLIFTEKLFGLVSIDVLIWYFLWLFFTLLFYEHFFLREYAIAASGFLQKISAVFLTIIIIILFLFYTSPHLLRWRFAYFFIGLFGALPLFYIIVKKYNIFSRLVKASAIPIILLFSFEITALNLDQWRFPGEYIGMLQIFKLAIPFEEMFFWVLSGTAIVLSYYELFAIQYLKNS